MTRRLLKIAVPVPLSECFDYVWSGDGPPPQPGSRVDVPFGRGRRIGMVVDLPDSTGLPSAKLKAVDDTLDDTPLLPAELLATLRWAADYYHHPLGEVLSHALPGLLRKGRPLTRGTRDARWALTAQGRAALAANPNPRAIQQARVLALLAHGPVAASSLREQGVTAAALKRLDEKGWIEKVENAAPGSKAALPIATPELPVATPELPVATLELPVATPELPVATPATPELPVATPELPILTLEQQNALAAMRERPAGYCAFLLHGATGSGKTEVFLRLVADQLAAGRQTLLLVPEIGLTPQVVRRLLDRFGPQLALMHSGLSDTERLDAWRRVRSGDAGVVVGTRSAVFAPLARPGLIVVDEEHDASYKQQQGFRYSARDLAVLRARRLNVPVVLASATPSLESFHNAAIGRYTRIEMPTRIGAAGEPRIRVVDLTKHASRRGLSTPLLTAIDRHVADGRQVLLFLNRRGFAPTLFCPSCHDSAECKRCDARLTVHAADGELRCHHCGAAQPLSWACATCGAERIAVGAGTQRVDDELKSLYHAHRIGRLDRDSTSRKGALDAVLAEASSGETRILVGTQMLTKGHDFPHVTLVGVLNADQGLFGTDFRSDERLAQTIVQVAGRAGRRDTPGEVLIQTHHPAHPLLECLLTRGYTAFAEQALTERREAGWPPFSHLAMWRAEAAKRQPVADFLGRVRAAAAGTRGAVKVLGPAPEPMERKAGRYRMQLLLKSAERGPLHQLLAKLVADVREWRETRRVRWSVDVDPLET